MSSALPPEMVFLKPVWAVTVADHCSDADYRKDTDPSESSRHYIDIDNYSEFIQHGYISQYMDTAIMFHGLSWVLDEGILPWSTLATYDSLKAAFSRGNWNQSALFAADLGHYVGDGHMPLHITRNFDGQYTGQSGVHSRYESKMINRYVDQILYDPDPAVLIQDVRGFIFSYLYYNYQYKDSVLLADDYSFVVNGSYTAYNFSDTLWSKTGYFTIPLFSHASYALASLIYTAWVEAGSPVFFPNGMEEMQNAYEIRIETASPNPFRGSTRITVNNASAPSFITLMVYDSRGVLVDELVNRTIPQGRFETVWEPQGMEAGVYYCVLKSEGRTSARKMVFVR